MGFKMLGTEGFSPPFRALKAFGLYYPKSLREKQALLLLGLRGGGGEWLLWYRL